MCQRPQSSAGYHSAGRFPSGRYRGGHRRQRLLPAGEAGAAPPVGVVLMRPQTQPAHRRLLIRHLEVQPDPRQRRQGFRPFAVHRQPQGSVSSEVHAPVADNHYLFAAQVVPAAVDEGFICQALRIALDAVRLKIVQAGFSSAPPRRWGRYALLR